MASPRARGWSRRHFRSTRRFYGFPACAGVEPTRSRNAAARQRLPRTRGGGSDKAVVQRLAMPGFPAEAGVEHTQTVRSSMCLRVPRVRGGGPLRPAEPGLKQRCSPRVRGWADPRFSRTELLAVFPACAGVGLWEEPGSRCTHGVPRVRGGGPSAKTLSGTTAEFSPHRRGWTLRNRRTAITGPGFSPHGRGWAADGSLLARWTCVFPARAGVAPSACGRGSGRRPLRPWGSDRWRGGATVVLGRCLWRRLLSARRPGGSRRVSRLSLLGCWGGGRRR